MSEVDEAGRLTAKLDLLVRLSALQLIVGLPSLKERAIILNKAGMSPKEIASLCDSTPNAVSVALSTAKRERKG